MKLSLFLVALVATLCSAYEEEYVLKKRFIKCDNVLSVKVCDKFRNVATTLKLKADTIEEAVKDAYNKGITKAEEVKTSVETFLQEKILSKQCSDLVDQKFCDKLGQIGQYLKKKGEELKPYIVKAMLAGAVKATDIKNKVEDYIRNDLMKKTCTDIMPAEHCQKIKDIGEALKLKAGEIKKATIESIMKGYNKIRDTVMVTLTTMKKYAENFTCEELLNPDVCVSLREYARKIRIGVPKMMNAVRSAIIMGYKVGKGTLSGIYKIADAFIDCEHLLSKDKCDKIKEMANKVGATAVKVRDALKEAITKGITEAKKIYASALNYLKNKFGRRRRSIMEKRDLQSVLQIYKEMLKTGIAKTEVYLKKAIEKTIDALKIADAKIRKLVEKAILEGKGKYNDLKKLIEDLLAKKNGDLTISKRDAPSLRSLLTKALSTATGVVRFTIETLLTMTNQQLQRIKRYVQSIIDQVIGESKRDVDAFMMDEASDSLVEENFNEIAEEFEQSVGALVANAADETENLINEIAHEDRQKRLIDFDLKDFNLKEYILETLKQKFGKAYKKLVSKSGDIAMEVKEALQKAGSSMIDVAKVVLKKVNEMIEKLNAGPDF